MTAEEKHLQLRDYTVHKRQKEKNNRLEGEQRIDGEL
jgi:hypothetical protein